MELEALGVLESLAALELLAELAPLAAFAAESILTAGMVYATIANVPNRRISLRRVMVGRSVLSVGVSVMGCPSFWSQIMHL